MSAVAGNSVSDRAPRAQGLSLARSVAVAVGLVMLTVTQASGQYVLRCLGVASPPVPAPRHKLVGASYVSCAGVPAVVSLCTMIQFGYRDGRGQWRIETHSTDCTTKAGSPLVFKKSDTHCVGGYWRTFGMAFVTFPPGARPQALTAAGASPWVRIRCL